MSILRAVLKVASRDRQVRRMLINEIRKTAGEPSYKDYVEKKKKEGEKPLSKEDWESRVLGKGKEKKPSKQEKAYAEIESTLKKWEGLRDKDFQKAFDALPDSAKKGLATSAYPDYKKEFIKAVEIASRKKSRFPGQFADRHLMKVLNPKVAKFR